MVELWRSRELFSFLVRKDIKVKYKNSILGFLWSMLNPALTLIVYFLVFKVVLKNGVPSFAIYLFSGSAGLEPLPDGDRSGPPVPWSATAAS